MQKTLYAFISSRPVNLSDLSAYFLDCPREFFEIMDH
jgi:hypothetical protein